MKITRFSLLILPLLCAFSLDSAAQGFGGSLAAGDHTVFVGESNNGAFPGSVYVYADDAKPEAWIETDRLEPEDGFPGDRFGQAMDAAGDLLMVGMSGYGESAGAVIVYEKKQDGRWAESARITAADGLPEDVFGSSITLTRDFAAIAAPGRNQGAGAVYIFRRLENGAWNQEALLEAEDLKAGDGFGSSLASLHDQLLVGAPGQNEAKGAAYRYGLDPETNGWSQRARYDVPDMEARTRLGEVVTLGAGAAYVGAPGDNNRQGAVYVFSMDGQEEGRRAGYQVLTAYDGQRNSRFGSSIVVAEDELWIGAPGDSRLGSAYLFRDFGPLGWSGVQKVTGDDLSGRASFASAMLRHGDLAVFGATGVDGGEGMVLIFARNAETNIWEQRLAAVNDIKGFDAITGAEVKCENDKAAVFDCKGVSLMSFLPIKDMGGKRGIRVNDIWGWTDPQTDHEYALVGRTDGTSFVDVTDPHNPRYVGQLSKTEGSQTSVWRDIKVYKDHAYIVADGAGQHGMQVFDLSKLRDAAGEPVDFEADYIYDKIASAHNVVINELTGYAYVVGSSSGGETCGGGLHMVNIQNPTEPRFSGCFADASTGRNNTGYSHDAQCVIYQGPDTDHQGKEICFGSNETALSIADVSDKENPKALSVVSYPKVVYTHQGWLTEDHRYFYMNDEGDEPTGVVDGTRTLVWDVTDLEDPILVKEYIATTRSTDHNLYIRGNLMYQSNYDAGFRVLDISSPENPVEVGFLDTTPYRGRGGGSWSNYPYFKSGMVIVTSSREGLFVVRKEDVGL